MKTAENKIVKIEMNALQVELLYVAARKAHNSKIQTSDATLEYKLCVDLKNCLQHDFDYTDEMMDELRNKAK